MNNIQTVERGINKAPIVLSDATNQILQWEFCRLSLGIIGSLLIFFASIFFLNVFRKWFEDDSDSPEFVIMSAILAVSILVSGMLFVFFALSLFRVLVHPIL